MAACLVVLFPLYLYTTARLLPIVPLSLPTPLLLDSNLYYTPRGLVDAIATDLHSTRGCVCSPAPLKAHVASPNQKSNAANFGRYLANPHLSYISI